MNRLEKAAVACNEAAERIKEIEGRIAKMRDERRAEESLLSAARQDAADAHMELMSAAADYEEGKDG